ncbi:MAG: 3-phosphoshikimate 1-carboxyvinyltransferase [Phycisphaerales bacterium]|nr:MAG: 3-phosphoshikimate 1-carboxyvinyltransferase [Phycisphaerales bacterium]
MTNLLRAPLDVLPDPLPIPALRVGAPTKIAVRPPGSKSITNRALLLAGLASGSSSLRGALLDADDAQRMLGAVAALGARTTREGESAVRVEGVGGRWRTGGAGATLELGNAGTAVRFLTAAAGLADAPVVIDGDARMRERPIGQLVDALRALGGRVVYAGEEGCPPVRVEPSASFVGGEVVLPTLASGQFVSALLLAAPWLAEGVRIRIEGEPTSPPYIAMTLGLLRALGAKGVRASEDLRDIAVGHGPLGGFALDVEPDASGATYFWGAAAITPGLRCVAPGLTRGSSQGDARFVDALGAMGARVIERDGTLGVEGTGALRGVDIDMSDMPDAALTLAVVACFAQGPTTITGLRTLRVKETDRLAALENELTKLGARATAGADRLRIEPPPTDVAAAGAVVFDTYNDHRMAMALSLAGLRRGGVAVADPACVAKTYPRYWADLASLVEACGGPA